MMMASSVGFQMTDCLSYNFYECKGHPMDIPEFNRRAWDRQVELGNRWTVPVGPADVEAARQGHWSIVLTPNRPVPEEWLGEVSGREVLCLASGGGQQGPILAAAGAEVTVFDNSAKQLEQDRRVAEREGLSLQTVQGNMADLGVFAEGSFDIVVHPASNLFVPDVLPVWKEIFRVLRPSGVLMAGFCNPVLFLFDDDAAERSGEFVVRHAIPYSALDQLDEDQLRRLESEGTPLEFGHTLEDQIGGQLSAGFVITGFYEDRFRDDAEGTLTDYIPAFIATRAVKP